MSDHKPQLEPAADIFRLIGIVMLCFSCVGLFVLALALIGRVLWSML